MIEYALREIEGIVGSKNLLCDTANLYIFRAGAADLSCRGKPNAIVHVTSRDQVPEIMKIAYKYEIPVIPRGGGSSVTGVVAPVNGGIILDLKALDK
ncbi:MAG: FAD-binding protein, partial [Candidatus Methanomethylicia archaeon]